MKENALRKIDSITIEIVKEILYIENTVAQLLTLKKRLSLPTANEVDIFHENINNRKREEYPV